MPAGSCSVLPYGLPCRRYFRWWPISDWPGRAGIVVLCSVVLEIEHGIQTVVLRGMFLWGGVGRYPVVGAYLQMLDGGVSFVGKGVHFFDAQKLFGIQGHGGKCMGIVDTSGVIVHKEFMFGITACLYVVAHIDDVSVQYY